MIERLNKMSTNHIYDNHLELIAQMVENSKTTKEAARKIRELKAVKAKQKTPKKGA